MTDEIQYIEPGFRLVDGELINAMIDAIEAAGVSSVSVVTANGVSGTVTNPTTTPAITIILGAITPASVAAVGTVTGSNLSGTNTGNQTIILTGDVTGSGTGSFAATIANGAVSLAKMDNLAANSIIGNNTGLAATPIALSTSQTKTLLSLNNVENTALSTWAGSTNVTTLGTIATGTWNGSAINLASYSTGSITATQYPVFIGDSGSGGTRGAVPAPAMGDATKFLRGDATWQTIAGSGTVTSVSVVTANGISGSVATSTTTPAITLTLGAINPSSIGSTTPLPMQGFLPTNYQTGTTYTLVLTDSGKRVSCTNGSAITLTVPPNGTVAFPAETEVVLRQGGAGLLTVAAGVGVTINSFGSALGLGGRYAYATLKQSSTLDTWDLFGNIS